MNRPLLIVAACASLVCIVSFGAARTFGEFSLPFDSDNDRDGPRSEVEGGGSTITRTIDWSGEDGFELHIPADVTFVQGPDSKLEITGASGTVNAIELDDDALRFRDRVRHADGVKVRLTAPDVERFEINGAGKLRLEKFDHDRLEVHVRGAADVSGSGKAREVEIHMAGAGDVDLGAVQAETAEVHIAGAGEATVSPMRRVEVHIAGAGDVRVTTRPAEVESHVAGAGGIKFVSPMTPEAPAISEKPAAPAAPPAPAKNAV